eukprot:02634_3
MTLKVFLLLPLKCWLVCDRNWRRAYQKISKGLSHRRGHKTRLRDQRSNNSQRAYQSSRRHREHRLPHSRESSAPRQTTRRRGNTCMHSSLWVRNTMGRDSGCDVRCRFGAQRVYSGAFTKESRVCQPERRRELCDCIPRGLRRDQILCRSSVRTSRKGVARGYSQSCEREGALRRDAERTASSNGTYRNMHDGRYGHGTHTIHRKGVFLCCQILSQSTWRPDFDVRTNIPGNKRENGRNPSRKRDSTNQSRARFEAANRIRGVAKTMSKRADHLSKMLHPSYDMEGSLYLSTTETPNTVHLP